MSNLKFENTLAYFCSPVLMDKKISNLVSVSNNEFPNIEELLYFYNCKLNKFDIILEPICKCGNRTLIFVYRYNSFNNYLNKKEIRGILKDYGYRKTNASEFLDILKLKMMKDKFPHEIGIFLGYPLTDVKGFIKNKGKNYKYCGYWKIYGDVDSSVRLFKIYDSLRDFMLRKLSCGETIENILTQFQNKLNIA